MSKPETPAGPEPRPPPGAPPVIEGVAITGHAMKQTLSDVIGAIRAVSDSPGAAPLHAYVRQGADEFAQILPAFPAHGIQPVSEMGQIFEPTPGEVDREKTGRTMEDYRKYDDARKEEALSNMDGQQHGRGR